MWKTLVCTFYDGQCMVWRSQSQCLLPTLEIIKHVQGNHQPCSICVACLQFPLLLVCLLMNEESSWESAIFNSSLHWSAMCAVCFIRHPHHSIPNWANWSMICVDDVCLLGACPLFSPSMRCAICVFNSRPLFNICAHANALHSTHTHMIFTNCHLAFCFMLYWFIH